MHAPKPHSGSFSVRALGADVCGVSVAALALVAWDVAVGSSFAPAVPVGEGTFVFVTSVWGLGTLLASLVVALRRGLGALAERWSPFGLAVAGALDGAAVVSLGVLATNPPSWSPNRRLVVFLTFLVVGAVTRVLVAKLARARPRLVSIVAGAACVLCATALLALLQWRREEWARLALHLVYFAGAAAFANAWLRDRRAAGTAAIALVAAAACAFVLGNALFFGRSMDARKLLHLRSSHGKAWSVVAERLFDRDGDRVSWLFGGFDCDPSRRDVYPGATEVPGNGRDDNCQRGDRRREPRPSPRASSTGTATDRPDIASTRASSTGTATDRPDIVILSVDSLRWDVADRLVATRRSLGATAELTRAVTPCPRTLDALAATARGRATRQLRLESVPETRGAVLWRDPSPTLGHALTKAGYRAVVIPTGGKTEARAGGFAGFESVIASNFDARARPPSVSPYAYRHVESEVAFSTALDLARSTPGPLLLWVHMLETHAPYYSSFDRSGPETREGFDRSVAYADRLIAKLLRDLEHIRRRPRIVTVLADHGEELGEHGSGYHASSVYAEQARVTWLIAGPGVPAGRFAAPVSIASLPATLLDVLGLPVLDTMTAPSLLPAMRGHSSWPTLAVTELRAGNRMWVGYTAARYRLVRDLSHRVDELFDSERDPLEQHDLSASLPEVLRTMRALAESWEEAH